MGGGVVITQLCVLYVFHIINNLIKDKKNVLHCLSIVNQV